MKNAANINSKESQTLKTDYIKHLLEAKNFHYKNRAWSIVEKIDKELKELHK